MVFGKKICLHLLFLLILPISLVSFVFFYLSKGKGSNFYEEVHLGLNESSFPYINVLIEGCSYPMVIDLGSRLEMTLQSEQLKHLSSHPDGIEKWKNFRGNEFVRQNYRIPEAKIGSIKFKNIKITEELSEEKDDCTIWIHPNSKKATQKTVGSLGRTLFKSTNLLFDAKQSKLIASNDFNRLKSNGYDLKKYLKIPFTNNSKGIVLEVDTGIGNLNLLLDTGFTLTMIREQIYPTFTEKVLDYRGLPTYESNKFSIQGKDFGSKDLYFLKIAKDLQEFDGFLGMDFIKNHVLYIDFSNEVLYIE